MWEALYYSYTLCEHSIFKLLSSPYFKYKQVVHITLLCLQCHFPLQMEIMSPPPQLSGFFILDLCRLSPTGQKTLPVPYLSQLLNLILILFTFCWHIGVMHVILETELTEWLLTCLIFPCTLTCPSSYCLPESFLHPPSPPWTCWSSAASDEDKPDRPLTWPKYLIFTSVRTHIYLSLKSQHS